jgi:hypothetical protein
MMHISLGPIHEPNRPFIYLLKTNFHKKQTPIDPPTKEEHPPFATHKRTKLTTMLSRSLCTQATILKKEKYSAFYVLFGKRMNMKLNFYSASTIDQAIKDQALISVLH